MMVELLAPDFVFSQSNLQTFSYCRRRFFLRYVRKLIWPAQLVSDQQYTRDREAGVRFHRLLHQYFLGFDPAQLHKVAEADPDPRLETWFKTFLSSPLSHLEGQLLAETSYTTTVADHALTAKFDLLQINGESVQIYDWKTSTNLPLRPSLQKNAQSKVYPLVVSHVFQDNPGFLKPEKLSMVYWEANFPDQIIEIKSSPSDWQAYEDEISAWIGLILNLKEEEFAATPDLKKCSWCEYRSYCQREKVSHIEEVIPEIDLIDDEMKIPEDAFDLGE